MTERDDTSDAAQQGEPGADTMPADQTAEGLGDVEIGREDEQDAPSGGEAPS